MKTSTNQKTAKIISFHSNRIPTYPNATAGRERFEAILNYLLTAATGAGFVTALLFLFTIC